jgi:hypothetical protein
MSSTWHLRVRELGEPVRAGEQQVEVDQVVRCERGGPGRAAPGGQRNGTFGGTASRRPAGHEHRRCPPVRWPHDRLGAAGADERIRRLRRPQARMPTRSAVAVKGGQPLGPVTRPSSRVNTSPMSGQSPGHASCSSAWRIFHRRRPSTVRLSSESDRWGRVGLAVVLLDEPASDLGHGAGDPPACAVVVEVLPPQAAQLGPADPLRLDGRAAGDRSGGYVTDREDGRAASPCLVQSCKFNCQREVGPPSSRRSFGPSGRLRPSRSGRMTVGWSTRVPRTGCRSHRDRPLGDLWPCDPPRPCPGPRTPTGCEECLAQSTQWTHLRLCLSCGHVGCCDTSRGRHATAHQRHTSHPVIRSYDPAEDWCWCYLDETAF